MTLTNIRPYRIISYRIKYISKKGFFFCKEATRKVLHSKLVLTTFYT